MSDKKKGKCVGEEVKLKTANALKVKITFSRLIINYLITGSTHFV